MTTLQLARLLQKSVLTSLLVGLLIFLASLFAQLSGERSRAAAPQNCGGTFAGRWRPANSTGSWNIQVQGNTAVATYRLGTQTRVMNGRISGNRYSGTWSARDAIDAPVPGTFVAFLNPTEGKISVTFRASGFQESAEWFCGTIRTPPPPPPTPTPTGVHTPPPSPTPTPEPSPNANSIQDDQDIDDFKLFDSIDPVEQKKVLVRRGPRLPVAYTASDLSMRVLVKGGWPIILEYGLAAEELAIMSIQVADRRPFLVKLPPSPRNTINLHVPRVGSDEIIVAKVRIKTAADTDDFRLYGFGMGEKATGALRQITADLPRFTLAMNNVDDGLASNPSLLRLLTPQAGSSLSLSVTLPAKLKVKQKPEQRIEFSCTSNSDFSDGRFEWWRVRGLDWEKVWQHGSGSLSRNQPRSQKWNGIIRSVKDVSIGTHALHFNAWQKSGSEHEWVTARTNPELEVIE